MTIYIKIKKFLLKNLSTEEPSIDNKLNKAFPSNTEIPNQTAKNKEYSKSPILKKKGNRGNDTSTSKTPLKKNYNLDSNQLSNKKLHPIKYESNGLSKLKKDMEKKTFYPNSKKNAIPKQENCKNEVDEIVTVMVTNDSQIQNIGTNQDHLSRSLTQKDISRQDTVENKKDSRKTARAGELTPSKSKRETTLSRTRAVKNNSQKNDKEFISNSLLQQSDVVDEYPASKKNSNTIKKDTKSSKLKLSEKKAIARESRRLIDDIELFFNSGIKKVNEYEKMIGKDYNVENSFKDSVKEKIKELTGMMRKDHEIYMQNLK